MKNQIKNWMFLGGYKSIIILLLLFTFNIEESYTDEARVFPVGPHAGTTRSGERVKDPDAFKGEAEMADVSKHIHGPMYTFYVYGEKPGIYTAEFSLKVSDNSIDKRILICDAGEYNGPFTYPPEFASREINAKEFNSSNKYQNFLLEYKVSSEGFVAFNVRWFGGVNVWWDKVTVKFEKAFTDEDLYQILKPEDEPSGLSINKDQFRVFEAYGLFAEVWRVKESVTMIKGAERIVSFFSYHPQRSGVIPEYPDTYEKLFKYNVIILNNVNVIGLKVTGRKRLIDFVEAGGILILLGDTHSLAQGDITGTLIENILPVKLSPPRDVVRSDIPLYLESSSRLSNLKLDWSKKPYTIYYHKVDRVYGDVLLHSGSIPLIVEHKRGFGKVIVILLSVLDEHKEGEIGIPFWEWSDWPKLLSALMQEQE